MFFLNYFLQVKLGPATVEPHLNTTLTTRVQQISCGRSHSAVLMDSGEGTDFQTCATHVHEYIREKSFNLTVMISGGLHVFIRIIYVKTPYPTPAYPVPKVIGIMDKQTYRVTNNGIGQLN